MPTISLPEGPDSAQLYLDLLKRCLINWIYGDAEEKPLKRKGLFQRALVSALSANNMRLARVKPFNPQRRIEGLDWPPSAHTMIGWKRLENFQLCIELALRDTVPGDIIECGVWRGGASILARAVLKAHGVRDRRVWLADSFQGLPPPRAEFPHDTDSDLHTNPFLAVAREEVERNFKRYGLLDAQVQFLEGWFCDTLPDAPVEQLAVIRLDGDMYESTMDALTNLYPKLSPGGYLIVDDYGAVPACKEAVHEYRRLHGIEEEIIPIDWAGVFWRRR
jgi:O-methyltransferase